MSPRPLHETVRDALKEYMLTLEGDDPTELYAMVMREVERPLLECALQHCEGNQTRAAQCLAAQPGRRPVFCGANRAGNDSAS